MPTFSEKPADGFTLIEMVIVLAVVASLAAILSPVVSNYVNEARITRASSETQSMADAILNFYKSTGKYPIFKSGLNVTTSGATFVSLETPGDDPACDIDCSLWLSSTATDRGSIVDILERNTPGYTTTGKFAWRGPYLVNSAADPWGNKYVFNADSLKYGGTPMAGFVLSAGTNGKIETDFTQNIGSGALAVSVGGDDIAARVR